MALTLDRYYVGQGEAVLFKRTASGTRQNGRVIGDCQSINIQGSAEELVHTEKRTGKMLEDDKINWGFKVNIALTFDNFSKENLAWLFAGKQQLVNAGTATAEPQIYAQVMQLNNFNVSSVVLKKAATVIPATNYKVSASGLIQTLVDPPLAGVIDGDAITADYSFGQFEEVGAFNDTTAEYWFATHAINKSTKATGSESPVALDCFRVIFKPDFDFELIGEDYGKLQIQGKVLLDAKQLDTSIGGQFFRERQLVAV